MKKILLTFMLSVITFLSVNGVFAADPQKVIVSEKVPGANCEPIYRDEEGNAMDDGQRAQAILDGKTPTRSDAVSVTQRKYQCTIEPGLAGFQNMFATIIRWFVNIVMLIGVLAIVGLGIAWSLAGGDDAKAKSELKKWGMNIFVGMIILFFFRYILQFLAPWIYG